MKIEMTLVVFDVDLCHSYFSFWFEVCYLVLSLILCNWIDLGTFDLPNPLLLSLLVALL